VRPKRPPLILTYRKLVQRIRVPLGFLFAAIFLIFARPTWQTLLAGGIVAAGGLALRAWASGYLRKNSELTMTGPYGYTRNPLYAGSFLLGVGFTIASAVWWLGILFIVLFLGIYFPVMKAEAEELRALFGAAFAEYEKNVPMLLIRLTPWKKSSAKFDSAQYMIYREYRAALGGLISFAILAAKAFLLG
jgi:protein-S-isoprenylcysteine O-methyltransferase Ste14